MALGTLGQPPESWRTTKCTNQQPLQILDDRNSAGDDLAMTWR
jgi:hypothetical protein